MRFSHLTAPRQALVRLFQSINFGFVEAVEVRDGEPLFNPAPDVVVEVKLDATEDPRPEITLADYELKEEVVRLADELDALRNGSIRRIDVRFGLPRRVLIERPIRGVRQ